MQTRVVVDVMGSPVPIVLASALAAALLGLAGCGGPRQENVSVVAPLQEGRVFETRLFAALEPRAFMKDAVNVSIGPLVPGMKLDEAQRLLGPPIATRRDVQCTYYRFANTPPGVELSHCIGHGSGGGTWEKWRVVASPGDNRASAVFTDVVRDLIDRAGTLTEITIHEGDERASTVAFSARLAEGRVSQLCWYDITDFREYKKLHNNELQRTRPAQATEPRR